MSRNEEQNGIPLFDGTNYNNWMFRLTTLLDEKDLLKFIEKSLTVVIATCSDDAAKTQAKLDEKKCKTAIVKSVHDSQLEIIKDKKTAKEMIDALKSVFERKSIASQLLLRKQLLTLRYNASDEIGDFFLTFDKLIRDLKSAGANIEEIDIVCHLLLTMPKSFDGLVTALETMEQEKLTMDFVKSRLLDESNKQKSGSSKSTSGSIAMNANTICYFCNKPGHIKSQCRKFKQQNKNKSKKFQKRAENANTADVESKNEYLLCAVEADNFENVAQCESLFCHKNKTNKQRKDRIHKSDDAIEIKFILDSGATEHMVNNKEYFDCLYNIDSIDIAVAKKDQKLKATQRGDITMKTFHNETKTMKNVLFVKELKCNLMSIPSLTKKGYKIKFDGDFAYVSFNGKTQFTAKANGKLFEVILYKNKNEFACIGNERVYDSQNLWHFRLGHLNINDMKRLINQEMVNGLDKLKIKKEIDFCESCIKAKQTRLPFPKHNEIRSTRVLELIHSDVCGKMSQTAYDGSNYFVTFTDDYSRATMVYCIKNKSDVLEKFREYKAMAEAQHGCKIAKLRVDNGGEYSSTDFKDFCKQGGIQINYTTPYNPEMNSISERLNRTLVEKARSMLIASGIQRKFWNEAIYTANYIKNRCPTNAVGNQFKHQTPAEIWYKRKPNLSNLKVFGSMCYNHIPDEKRSKFDAKSSKCLFLGYVSSNSYRLWNIEENKFIIGRNVIFNEDSVIKQIKYVNILLDSEAENDMNPKQQNNDAAITPSNSKSVSTNTENNNSIDMNNTGDINENIHSVDMDHTGDNEDNIHSANLEGTGNFKDNSHSANGDCIGDVTEISHAGSWSPKPVRRSRRESVKPVRYGFEEQSEDAHFALSAERYVDNDPITLFEAQQRPDWMQWKTAIDSEYDSLIKNKTWILCDLPKDRKPIGCKWVFKLKHKANGEIDKYKARLVAKGYSQKAGFDYNETYAPVAKLTTLRILLSIAVHFDMEIHQMDVKCAFLNGQLNEDIFMIQPEGFIKDKTKVCKLQRSIYGLKQASRVWYERFNYFMMKINFKRCISDQCVYIKNENGIQCFVLLYVDDLLIMSSDQKKINVIKNLLNKEFEMTDIGKAETFLGMFIQQNIEDGTITLNQTQYLKKVLQKFGMSDCKSIATPIEVGLNLQKGNSSELPNIPYRELIGCLIYATITARPDLCAAVNYFSQFQSCYTMEHFTHAKRILRYIQGTLNMKMVFHKNEKANLLVGFTDSDWGNDKNDRKSISGYVFKVFNNTVSWASRKQSTVSLSSTEAEYISLANGVCEAKWLRSILKELNFNCSSPTIIHEDNQSCMKIAQDSCQHKKMKHIDIKFNFVRDTISNKEVQLKYIPTNDQLADIMTKPIGKILFFKHVQNLNLIS